MNSWFGSKSPKSQPPSLPERHQLAVLLVGQKPEEYLSNFTSPPEVEPPEACFKTLGEHKVLTFKSTPVYIFAITPTLLDSLVSDGFFSTKSDRVYIFFIGTKGTVPRQVTTDYAEQFDEQCVRMYINKMAKTYLELQKQFISPADPRPKPTHLSSSTPTKEQTKPPTTEQNNWNCHLRNQQQSPPPSLNSNNFNSKQTQGPTPPSAQYPSQPLPQYPLQPQPQPQIALQVQSQPQLALQIQPQPQPQPVLQIQPHPQPENTELSESTKLYQYSHQTFVAQSESKPKRSEETPPLDILNVKPMTTQLTFDETWKRFLLRNDITENFYLKVLVGFDGKLEKVARSWFVGLDTTNTVELQEFLTVMKKFEKKMV